MFKLQKRTIHYRTVYKEGSEVRELEGFGRWEDICFNKYYSPLRKISDSLTKVDTRIIKVKDSEYKAFKPMKKPQRQEFKQLTLSLD